MIIVKGLDSWLFPYVPRDKQHVFLGKLSKGHIFGGVNQSLMNLDLKVPKSIKTFQGGKTYYFSVGAI